MKKIFHVKKVLIAIGALALISSFLFLFSDAVLNRNFRTTRDKIISTEQINLEGLRELNASGGAAVHFFDLKRRLGHIAGQKLIVDGMTEFHGYLAGIPTTFFAYQAPERYHWKYNIRQLIFTGTTEALPHRVVVERDEALQNGFSYINLNIGSRFIPSHEKIDEIVQILEDLHPDVWVHFHCHHGKGRTSMMLIMFDIMRNAPQVSLHDIVKRQYLLGSEDLMNTTVWARGSYTQEQLNQRRDFIVQFYDFICQRKEGGVPLWSTWKRQNESSI